MIKELITDEAFLQQPSAEASIEDAHIAQDLIDTMESMSDNCACLAANQIGELKAIIANYESLIKVAEETRLECTMYHYARNLSIQRELCLVALDYLKTNPEEFSLSAAEKAGSERLSLLR